MAKTVLIIDDAIHIRRLVARVLQQSGFDTLEAADGRQGVSLLKEQKPDIVTCDISMPYMDGYQFLEIAKRDPVPVKDGFWCAVGKLVQRSAERPGK